MVAGSIPRIGGPVRAASTVSADGGSTSKTRSSFSQESPPTVNPIARSVCHTVLVTGIVYMHTDGAAFGTIGKTVQSRLLLIPPSVPQRHRAGQRHLLRSGDELIRQTKGQ